ncbi:MAG: hypothetical protein CM15mP102_16030 [Flavobacteriales bacterium]|nr:MAG: hypothetical protein CM15mP102_16030 [Flavobacteriales bacterium]
MKVASVENNILNDQSALMSSLTTFFPSATNSLFDSRNFFYLIVELVYVDY